MSFLYPLGLIGLIGVPLLILIYILRSKYNEQTVASTYLWTLSEKFFKRRNPLSGITGIISLILQILTVIIISMLIARPVFTVPDSASEYCFLIDASGSMNTEDGGRTYFERAKDEIADMIDDARLGSSYTLISVSTDASVVYERLTDKGLAKELLSELASSDGTVDYADALRRSQKYFDNNPSTVIRFVTDKDFAAAENVEIVNISSQKAKNYAISEASGTLTDGTLYTSATVTSYTDDATLTVELYVNGSDKAADSVTLSLKAGESLPVELSCEAAAYEHFRIAIKNSDDLPIDNEVISYNLASEESYSILLVSETPLFYEAFFDARTDSVVDVISPAEYTGQKGYGLYVFHSFTPAELPDAAVWLINSTESVDNSGFGIRGVVGLNDPVELVKSSSTATRARELLSSVEGKEIYVKEYVKYSGMYTQFTTLFSCESNPVIFAGVNALGNREVVFGFDIHNAHMSLTTDFVILLSNLLEYSCPDLIDRSDFVCGEDLNVNITANINSVKVISPDGEERYLDTSTDLGVTTLDRVGSYKVEVDATDGNKTYFVYAAAPASESDPAAVGENFSVTGTKAFDKTDGQYDPVVLLFVLLAVVFCADWMVYCYEKYQLR